MSSGRRARSIRLRRGRCRGKAGGAFGGIVGFGVSGWGSWGVWHGMDITYFLFCVVGLGSDRSGVAS